MRVKWGDNNETLTLSVTGENFQKSDEKLFLSVLEKQVCDREVLRQVVTARVSDAQTKMHKACEELARLKEQTFIAHVTRPFKQLKSKIYRRLNLGDWNW